MFTLQKMSLVSLGMRCYGAVRHGPDIRVRELYEEGDDDEYPEEAQAEPAPAEPAPADAE